MDPPAVYLQIFLTIGYVLIFVVLAITALKVNIFTMRSFF